MSGSALGDEGSAEQACSVSGQAAGHSRHAGGARPGNSAIDAVKVCR